jgi:hypothetical protein
MKKSLVFLLCFVLILSLTFVSAGWFGDFFDKITGKVSESEDFGEELFSEGESGIEVSDVVEEKVIEEVEKEIEDLEEIDKRGILHKILNKKKIENLENKKNISKYSEKEVFLISDKNWKDVLSLVPVAVWTEFYSTGISDYNISKYPLLIYHEEDEKTNVFFSEEDFEFWLSENNFSMEISLSTNNLEVGEELILTVSVQNIANYQNYLDELSLENYYLLLDLISEPEYEIEDYFLPGEIREYQFNFTFFGTESGFDADSVIYFMQQYNVEKVTIIGESPVELDDLLIAQPELGVGLNSDQIKRIGVNDYLSYWKNNSDVVYVKNNYELSLMASTYASLINAPLIIEGTELDKDINFENKNIICVWNVFVEKPNYTIPRDCNEKYRLEGLQKKYIDKTNTDKIILVNPNDLDIKVEEEFQSEKSGNPIYEIYSKTSLASPILASTKHEVIFSKNSPEDFLDITCKNFDNLINNIDKFDKFVEDKISLLSNSNYLTIISSPQAIPQSFNERCDPDEFYYHLKNSVDNVYASSDNYTLSNRDQFDFKIDSQGIAHIVREVNLNHRGQIWYQKYNLLTGEWSFQRNIAENFQYSANPQLEIDIEDNIHILFSGNFIGENDFAVYYKKLNQNGDILEELKFFNESISYNHNIELGKDNEIHIVFNVVLHNPYRKGIYYSKIKKGELLFTKKISEKKANLGPNRFFIDKYNVANIFWMDLLNWSNWDKVIMNHSKINQMGDIINMGPLFDFEEVIILNFDVDLDSNEEPLIFMIGGNLTNESLAYYIYRENMWKEILSSDLNWGDTFFEIFLDKFDKIHFIQDKEISIGGGPPVLGVVYSKMDLNGNFLVEGELIAPKENFIFSSSNSLLEVHDSNTEQKPFVLIEIQSILKNGSLIHLSGGNKFPPHYSIKENFVWNDSLPVEGFPFKTNYNMKFGRIYGITLSDVSSYLGRILFNNQIVQSEKNGISLGHDIESSAFSVNRTTNKMIENGYSWSCFNDIEGGICETLFNESGEILINSSYFENKSFISYDDHGSPWSWWKVLYYDEIPLLKNSFGLGDACSTNNFRTGKEKTFGAWFLRRGGIGYFGSSGVTWLSCTNKIPGYEEKCAKTIDLATDHLLEENLTMGELYKKLEKDFPVFKTDYLSYGDPTLELKLS